MNSYVTVGLYDTLGLEAVEYICNLADIEVVVVESKKVDILLVMRERLRTLNTLIIMERDPLSDVVNRAKERGYNVYTMGELETSGADLLGLYFPEPPEPEDPALICFTSGTTGPPKGCVHTHAMAIAAVSGALYSAGMNTLEQDIETEGVFNPGEEVYLSYLPLPHIMERLLFVSYMSIGARIGFFRGDVDGLVDDIQTLAPTVFASVPRLYNRIYDKIRAKIQSKGGMALWLFEHALKDKVRNYHQHGQLTHWLWDRVIFAKLKASLGGRVKCMLTGAAPLSKPVYDFISVAFGCPVIQGYGMTENFGAATATNIKDRVAGHVGGPMVCAELKLVDIPEMGYRVSDKPYPRGEILSRGPAHFRCYYKADEKTRESKTEDGWLISGDVGMLDDHGRIFIIDRKKELFKLAQGEYISPAKVEAALARIPIISQAYVEGDSHQYYPVAIIVLDPEVLLPWAESRDLPSGSVVEACADKRCMDLILAAIHMLGPVGSNQLNGFEVPAAIHIETEPFTVQNDMLTPTLKLKRAVARDKYKDVILQLYESLDKVKL